MAVRLITKTAYARHRGCDEKAVRKAVAEGRISLIDGKIDPAVADIQWAQNTRARADSGRSLAASVAGQGVSSQLLTPSLQTPENAPVMPMGTEPGYADYRARTEKANAERAERENSREAGRLVESSHVERGIYDAFRSLRDKAMAVGPRAAPRCVGLGDARDIERVITDEIRQAFAAWEQRMLELLPAREGDK